MSGLLDGLSVWMTDILDSLGYLGLAFLTFLENIFPPIPSELVLPMAGFLVSEGRFNFVAVLIAATLGSVLSSVVWWGVGRLFGEARVYRLVDRYGRWALLRTSDVQRADQFFREHGGKAVFFGRFVPGVRSLVSVPAGLADMPLVPFILYTALGSGLWNAVLITLGVVLRDRWESVLRYLDAFQYVAYAAILLLIAWFFFGRVRAWSVDRR